MNTRKCGHLAPCGCEDVALVTPAPCPDPGPCPTPYPCSEVTDAQCVIYSGDDILCDQTVVVSQGMTVAEAMASITDYFCNATGSISTDIICGADVVVPAGTPFGQAFELIVAYFCNNNPDDTGWVDMVGFAYYQGAMATQKPQVRRIGKQVHFRGNLYIPITDGAAVIPLTTQNTYRTVLRKTPFSGTGGVYFDTDNVMYFNNTGSAGGVVIPTSVLPTLTNLDGTYKLTREVASRQLQVFTTKDPDITEEGTALLHAPVEVSITASKQLKLTALSVLEQNSADVASFVGSSSLRNITSSFTCRQNMINFDSYLTGGTGLNSMGEAPKDRGTLVTNRSYFIKSYVAGDDFTNIGAVNQANTIFVATGTTPTNWLNGSVLYQVPNQLQSNAFFYPNLSSAAESSTWPLFLDGVTVNGANPSDLGGYVISLDGLVAFLS